MSSEIDRQRRLVESLRIAVYTRPDPSSVAEVQRQLVLEEDKLSKLEMQGTMSAAKNTADPVTATAGQARRLGKSTTGLEVESILCMQPFPTGISHLLDPESDPLVQVRVKNSSREVARVRIRVFIEGLSAESVKTVEIEQKSEIAVQLLPTLLPGYTKLIREIQRATLHILCENLDAKIETHETHHLVCLARTSSFNSVRNPSTGEYVDLTHYYGAWVTPYDDVVQEQIRRAADIRSEHQMWGYQGSRESVSDQVQAMYRSLRETGITYINSVIDYGNGDTYRTQRTRLPRQSLVSRSANCIDGTVLFASLLEGCSLNPALVLVPGHAFLAWEKWDGENDWDFLETTMIGNADYDAARRSGCEQYAQFQRGAAHLIRLHPLVELRRKGIYPME